MSYRDIITIEPDKRGGKPCIRRMRITVYDVLGWLASGMSTLEIIDDFPELTETDIRACLEFAADREHHLEAKSHNSHQSHLAPAASLKQPLRIDDEYARLEG